MRIDPQKLLSSCVEAILRGRRVRRGRGHCRIGAVRPDRFLRWRRRGRRNPDTPRRAPAPGDADPRSPRRVGIECPGVCLRCSDTHRVMVAKRHGIGGGRARTRTVYPVDGRWLPTVAPEVGRPQPFNPAWSLRACVVYDKYLHDRMSAMSIDKSALSACDRMAFALSGYNGGAGWVNRDRNLAAKKGLNPDRWFGHVETVNAGRKASAIRENRRYVSRIIKYQHAYIRRAGGRG